MEIIETVLENINGQEEAPIVFLLYVIICVCIYIYENTFCPEVA